MPPRAKSKTAPNQHDKRHESGLAAPGKRIYKQRSNGHLNGLPNGKPVAAVPSPPALPTTGLNQGFRFPRPADSLVDRAEVGSQSSARENVAAFERPARDRTQSDASVDDAGADVDMTDPQHEPLSTAPSVEAAAAAAAPAACKPDSALSARPLAAVSTILTYYPLRDAISILILLLSLPSTLVLLIQFLFASLTFVPPTTSISFSTLPNVKEMFNASNLGYPALATILIVDLIFWVCWLPVWKPVQTIFLDLSQTVIAVSLSGSAASTGGPTYSIATCTLIVCVVHVLRYRAIHLTALDYLRSVIHKTDIGTQFDVLPLASSLFSSTTVERGWIFTVARTILGIHIVSQGVTTCVRRWLVKANERDQQNAPAVTKTDSEVVPGSDPAGRPINGHLENTAQLPQSASAPDGRVSGLSTAPRDGKLRESSHKRKKKQANQIRSQQPLWAAIASTKVTFVKEMEQRDAADDARDAAAMDANSGTTFPSTTSNDLDRIWISEVRATEILFTLDLSPDATHDSADRMRAGVTISAGIDKSKPFYVRINGASWSSTRIMTSAIGRGSEDRSGDRFDGEIFGLTPLSSYHCEIVGISSGKVLCSASLITQAAPSAEQTAAAPSQPQHSALRPSSPITTLKQSIQSAEAKLNETRNRTRKSKKDHRGVHSDIRKEINVLKSKLESSGGLDDKQERRLLQINQHKSQAEEATADLKGQLGSLGDIPSRELAESDAKKRVWQAALDAKTAANRDLENAKAEADRELSSLKADVLAAETKRERLAARNTQRAQELEKLASKQQAERTAKQQRDYERAQILRIRQEEENQLRFHVVNMEAESHVLQQKAQEAYHQIAALQSWPTQPPPAYPGYSSPPTPEGTLPGANGSLNSSANGFPNFDPRAYQSPFTHSTQPHGSNTSGPRGRSSSMLSQVSGFTDKLAEDEYLLPEQRPHHTWPLQAPANGGPPILDDRKESESGRSGSLTNDGSTASSSPRPDAKPFVPVKMGPIRPPNKKSPQSPNQAASTVGSVR